MAYIESGQERIDPASDDDLDRLFEESRIFWVSVHRDRDHAIQATVTGGSAMLLFLDHKNATAKSPVEKIDRETAIAILKVYLHDGTLDPDFAWQNVKLPTVPDKGGCRGGAAMIVAFVLLTVAVLGSVTQL
ncbi:hypothetical protein [Thalassoroseus pseudoceratinae]|uniref:hypothetical protein n=1 Tax=Thalassoroseus pseudoceratinae TaxID=2713176 RepID=UPI00141DE72C|nr:hypothetical protein [Thalassoroseus pseudoceratinae]